MQPDEVSDVKSEKPKKKKKESLDSGVVKGEGKKKKKSKNAKEKLKSNIEETKTKDQDRTKGPRISVKEKKEKGANNETTVTKKRSKKSFKEPKQGSEIESVIEAPDIPTQDSVTNVEDINEGASETSEDRRMKDVLTRWNQDDDSSDSSDVSSDFSDEYQYCVDGRNSVHMTTEELGLEDNALDHILLAAPDFDEAMKDFETLTAIRPSIAGDRKSVV